ncbi:YdeI family protein [Leptothrix ochracea]|uniref:YdeI/OmpD-associated family protein n=1 Tax=Leptothrix ochracea TaxID=735331 RepID=UPI0034E265A9
MNSTTDPEPFLSFESDAAWAVWLAENHGVSSGVWLRLAKKSSKTLSVSYAQAIDVALCYGWIDGQKKGESEQHWLQRFTPRTRTSIWSKINREKALALIASGDMKAAGLKEVERAKNDGRWKDAYDSAKSATVPSDLQAALNLNAEAKAFFATLSGQNRYAVLFRIQTAKKPETRAKRIQMFVEMLGKHETLHP